MTKRNIISVLVMSLLIVIGASVFFLEKKDVGASLCPECGREIHADWAFTITPPKGKKQTLCCPHCGILTMLAQAVPPDRATATDFATGKPVRADQAVYVWNSDVNHCDRPQKMSQFNQQPMQLVFDRCFPSVIAFSRTEDAATFVKEHHGEIRSFTEVVQLLKQSTGQH